MMREYVVSLCPEDCRLRDCTPTRSLAAYRIDGVYCVCAAPQRPLMSAGPLDRTGTSWKAGWLDRWTLDAGRGRTDG